MQFNFWAGGDRGHGQAAEGGGEDAGGGQAADARLAGVVHRAAPAVPGVRPEDGGAALHLPLDLPAAHHRAVPPEVGVDGVEVLAEHHPLLVVPVLVEHLALEVQEVPPPGPDEETHQLVVYPVVDLRT